MASTDTRVPPPISWAQRKDLLYIIINVECKDIDYRFTEDSMYFKGVAAYDNNKKFEVSLDIRHEIIPDKVTVKNIGRCLEFTITKKSAGPYWSHLTKGSEKLPFLKVDFHKWVDPNSGSETEDSNEIALQKLIRSGRPDFQFSSDEEDSDDESIPQLT